MVKIELHDADAEELRALLDSALSDMSLEIADTDNAAFRGELRRRRESLQRVRSVLGP